MATVPPEWITLAFVKGARGNRGEVIVDPQGTTPDRFLEVGRVFIKSLDAPERLEIESAWSHGGLLILKFRGVNTISDAERLRGAELCVPFAERRALEPGEFFESDLIGCDLIDSQTGGALGRVTGLRSHGAAALLEVDGGAGGGVGGEWLVPFARSICVSIDVAARRIAVDLPVGLRELNQP
ncbi:MAG: ribosome maturation factor RimM [Bryobacteraceae bacterium]